MRHPTDQSLGRGEPGATGHGMCAKMAHAGFIMDSAPSLSSKSRPPRLPGRSSQRHRASACILHNKQFLRSDCRRKMRYVTPWFSTPREVQWERFAALRSTGRRIDRRESPSQNIRDFARMANDGRRTDRRHAPFHLPMSRWESKTILPRSCSQLRRRMLLQWPLLWLARWPGLPH